MSAEFLSVNDFKSLIAAGHSHLKQQVGVVNALNIFPVPDGDTGTNMEMSMGAGVQYLEKSKHTELGKALQDFSTGLMMGARGNSGVILSQLFRGFAKAGHELKQLDVQGFANALQEGVQIAYRAVAKPVEGTILTVAREAAQAGVREARKHQDLASWFEVVYATAQRALAKTPQQLEVLKQAGVVDSGGQGLVFIYEGFLGYLNGEQPSVSRVEATDTTLQLDYAGAHIEHEGQYGYCTEVLVRAETMDADTAEQQLRRELARYGDSLLVVSAEDLVRVHVHTLRPGRVLDDAIAIGSLVKIKIENMTEQHTEISQTKPSGGSHEPLPANPQKKPVAIVAVAAGEGLRDAFASLGVDVVLEGGQTMNPSTEDIVTAVQSANSDACILLPNNKNILLAAEQARAVIGNNLHLVKTETIPQGIAALMAYHPSHSVSDNVLKMRSASQDIDSGQVVRAVRNSVFQGKAIEEGQYLGFVNQSLTEVGASRIDTAIAVVRELNQKREGAELLTLFYGADVEASEISDFQNRIEAEFDLELEAQYGGQPVYDYIFSVE